MTVPTNVVSSNGVGVVPDALLNTYVQTAQTAAQLRGFIGINGMAVLLQGIASPGDGLAGAFYWNPGTGYHDDNRDTIVPSAAAAGAWLRLAMVNS